MTTEEENNQEMLSSEDVVSQIFSDFIIIVIGVISSIIFGLNAPKNKLLYILLPTLISILIFFIISSPQPKTAYFISLLYDDTPATYTSIATPTADITNGSGWSFIASSVISINDISHIYIGGSSGKDDMLVYYDIDLKKLINVIDKTSLSSKSASHSAVSFDITGNGMEDLIIGRENGVYLYKNHGNYSFEKTQLIGKQDKVPLAIAISDYNKDGRPDIYLSYMTHLNKYRGTVFNDKSHGRKNILLKNDTIDPDNIVMTDVSEQTGAGGMQLNTFTGSFIDLNNDDWPDLVLSHDSGEVEILKNIHGQKFESIIPSDLKGNYMGLASGDVDNDGDQDLFLTNIGIDAPANSLALGDIRPSQKQAFKHLLLRNDGNFKFVESSKEMGISGEGFGWGALFADIDNDSKLDLFFGENTVLFPSHHFFPKPGHFYSQNNSGQFERKFQFKNSAFAQTPLITDMNNDTLEDVVWINMHTPSLSMYLTKENTNNYIAVSIPPTVQFVNAKIVVDIGKKKIYRENIQGGLGMGGDTSGSTIVIGIGQATSIKTVSIYTIQDKQYTVHNPKINNTIKLKIISN